VAQTCWHPHAAGLTLGGQVLMPRRAMTRTDDFRWWDMAAMGFNVKTLGE
jgi:hypothetical protein